MATATGTNSAASTASTTISGLILVKESGVPIPNLLVWLFDINNWADPEGRNIATIARTAPLPANSSDGTVALNGRVLDLYKEGNRAGCGVTLEDGTFVIHVTARDFNLPDRSEQKPDLVLVVLAPDEPGLDLEKRLLHFSKDVRLNACSSESYIIRLPIALLKEKDIPFGVPAAPPEDTVESKVSLYVNDKKHELAFNAGVAAYHGEQATLDTQQRTAFRKDFFKKIATDHSAVPASGLLVADGDSVRDKNVQAVANGILTANALLGNTSAVGVPVNLYLTPADKADLQPFLGNPSGTFVDVPEANIRSILFSSNNTENPGTLLIHNNPIASFCAAHSVDGQSAKLLAGVTTSPEEPATPVVVEGTQSAISESRVLNYVDRLVTDIQAPDLVLKADFASKRGDKTSVDKSVKEFSLQKGPAEVPSFYDFNTIQIAFEHVWKQLFDETIPNLAFSANAIGKTRFGIDGMVNTSFKNGLLTAEVFCTIRSVEVPPIVARFFDITREEFNELSHTLRTVLEMLANQINECTVKTVTDKERRRLTHTGSKIADLRMIQSLTEQGERLIDAVRHDDYYTLHKTLRDLNARLSGKYEFTVFAADKDYHSVNFGLMNTYRQQWTPLSYQAGKLAKSIPMAPGQGCTYHTKTNRQEKRSSKEAKKNNSSIVNEQTTTARVEADIMSKVQNKNSFGLQAEGDFNVGLYEGKATTTFGVEAASESAQNRKDFREAVLKAVQEYKNETSTEITTESDYTSESSESGALKNESVEVSVTFLLWELQKLYRVSEEIYRVRPVIFVAQEVPSPDQITPAWIISNDWILNRCMLDDSFRPTLRYLANSSVGDDFSLRELRKNVRQQRNLVETLRIEFSAASMQADNRYAALEAVITNRIHQEHAERSDGLLNDVADFFGRGPGISTLFPRNSPDPEAVKARELAAKDAHQYALEKAEKASVALKQEINTLHALTQQYNKTLQERLDNETRVKRLQVHIRNNILYYMQAIWSHEPGDQRYLRLLKVMVPLLELENRSYRVQVAAEPPENDIFAQFRELGTEKHRAFMHGTLKHPPSGGFLTKSLVEVADLDTLLGFKGNYMIFPMKEHNALTEFMAAPYIDRAFGAMDPDELSNVNLDQYSKYVCCLHDQLTADQFTALKPQLKVWLEKLLASPLRNGDEIVVPTGSLFIESLVDPNPILEDFKLKHRELDVYKALQEGRMAALESIRLAARLLNAEREDPNIEKKIVVQGSGASPTIDVDDT